MILFFRSLRLSLRKRDDYSWSKAFANLRSSCRSFDFLCSAADLSAPTRRKYAYSRLQKFPSVPLLGFSDSSALQLLWLNRKLLPLRKMPKDQGHKRNLELVPSKKSRPKTFVLDIMFFRYASAFHFLSAAITLKPKHGHLFMLLASKYPFSPCEYACI